MSLARQLDGYADHNTVGTVFIELRFTAGWRRDLALESHLFETPLALT
jgi:hypothetical protein